MGGTTPLYAACHFGNLEAVRLLCAEPEVEPNISATEYDCNYALHGTMTGIGPEELLIIRALADKGAFMDCENSKKETPFVFGFKRLMENHPIAHNRLVALLALGAQKKQITYGAHQTGLLIGHIDNIINRFSVTTASGMVELVLDRRYYGPTFLDLCFHLAVLGIEPGSDFVTKSRYQGSEGLNRKDAIYGMTALMWAAALGHHRLLELLLAFPKIDITATDTFGDTALHYAARNGHASIVKSLLACPEGLSVLKNDCGATPYDLAKMRGHKEVGRLLGRERIIQTRIARYFTTQAGNNANAPTGWSFVPHEVAERFLAYRALPIGADGDKMRKITELCQKEI